MSKHWPPEGYATLTQHYHKILPINSHREYIIHNFIEIFGIDSIEKHQADEAVGKFAVLVSNISLNEEAKNELITSIIAIFPNSPRQEQELVTKIINLADEERKNLNETAGNQPNLDKYLIILDTKYPQSPNSENIESCFEYLGLIQNHKPSIEQFIKTLKATNQENEAVQLLLGHCYHNGTDKNLAIAYDYYLAAARGSEEKSDILSKKQSQRTTINERAETLLCELIPQKTAEPLDWEESDTEPLDLVNEFELGHNGHELGNGFGLGHNGFGAGFHPTSAHPISHNPSKSPEK